jgi:hypothetical protein
VPLPTIKKRGYTKEQKTSLILTAIIMITFMSITPFIYRSIIENSAFEEPHTFHLTFDVGINKSYAFNPDVQIDLKISYPRGILIDGDPVEISGVAAINTPIAKNIEVMDLVFQNGLAYPITQDSRGITKGMNFTLFRINESIFEGKSAIIWNLVGTYYPQLYIKSLENDGRQMIRYSDTKDMAITVFPKTQLIQVATNKATLLLACAAYLLALVGAFNIIYSLWTRKPINQVVSNENEDYKEKKCESNKINRVSDKANEKIGIVKDPNSSSRPDCPKREKQQ